MLTTYVRNSNEIIGVATNELTELSSGDDKKMYCLIDILGLVT